MIYKGFQNEINFAEILNNKRVKDLPKELQNLVNSIFPNIRKYDKIESWQSKYAYEKADIKVKTNGELKGISIKTGHQCSMHQESVNTFYPFLIKIGIDNNIIEKIDKFMKGFVNGVRVTAKSYIESNPGDIGDIRLNLNEYYVKANLIIRCLFQGTERQQYDCDAIIHGTPDNFMWATKGEILKYMLEYQTSEENYINISVLNLKCYDRNLRENPMKETSQNEIQIKWYTIERDLKEITKIREREKAENKN